VTTSAGASNELSYTYELITTQTTLVASPASPSVYSENVTFTATVTKTGAGSGEPGGYVDFQFGGGIDDQQVPVNSDGTAVFSTKALPVGSYTVVAAYQGDYHFEPSVAYLPYTVNKAQTTATLHSSLNPSVYGQLVSFSVVVAQNQPATLKPDGEVEFH